MTNYVLKHTTETISFNPAHEYSITRYFKCVMDVINIYVSLWIFAFKAGPSVCYHAIDIVEENKLFLKFISN